MSDVFGEVARAQQSFFRDAAVACAHELGLFEALAEPRSLEELASIVGVAPRRVRALCDLLVAEGALARAGSRLARAGEVPRSPPLASRGWGRLAEVLLSGRPLTEDLDDARFHAHLLRAGAGAARDLWSRLGTSGTLLDLGGGAGAYSAAWLDAAPGASATLVDRAPVVELARAELSRFGARVRFVAGDALTLALGGGYDVVLLSHLLHLHAPADCALLVRRAAAAAAPRGRVVIKEVLVEADRSGPPSGLAFALNMALYTEGGDAYDPVELAAWLTSAGLVEPRIERFPPDGVGVWARK